MIELRPFQRDFLRELLRPDIKTAVLSCARGNGKSTFCAYLLSRIMDPDDELFEAGTENIITAASLAQARIVYKIAKKMLEEKGIGDEYKFQDSAQKIGITHKETGTKVVGHSGTGKTLFGLVGVRYLILDEPGVLEIAAAERLWSAVRTSHGKLDSTLKVVVIGHRAPNATKPGHWYYDLIKTGSKGSAFVMNFEGSRSDPFNWNKSIRKANPLLFRNPALADALKEERKEALTDPSKKAEFLAYRLNLPSRPDNTMLVTVDAWKASLRRPVAPRRGKPIVGIDLGQNRAWSACVAIWQTGRVEALALAPGLPNLAMQEKRDGVPRGAYSRIENLRVAEGLNVPPVEMLWGAIIEKWGTPVRVVCDRLRLGELRDSVPSSLFIETRKGLWSESTADIRSFRRCLLDGKVSIDPASQSLIEASLAVSTVQADTSGNLRLIKDKNNRARDDVAAAFLLACGAFERANAKPEKRTGTRTAIIR